jgi:hypothetical protein
MMITMNKKYLKDVKIYVNNEQIGSVTSLTISYN